MTTIFSSLWNKACEIFSRKPDSPWYILPPELLTHILNLVGEPTRTAQIDRRCRELSKHFYLELVKQFPVPSGHLKPHVLLFNTIIANAKDLRIPMTSVQELSQKTDPFSPAFLHQVIAWQKDMSLQNFCRRVFSTNETDVRLLDSDDSIKSRTELDLSHCTMTHLTPKIELFTALTTLKLGMCKLIELPLELKKITSLKKLELHGNRLSVENVRAICNPSLESVCISSRDEPLIELFRTEFPKIHLNLVRMVSFVDDPVE